MFSVVSIRGPGSTLGSERWRKTPVGRMLPDGFQQLLPGYSLNSRFALFSGPYSHGGLNRDDENLAVTVLAGFR